jgi:hypothetical protein
MNAKGKPAQSTLKARLKRFIAREPKREAYHQKQLKKIEDDAEKEWKVEQILDSLQ